MDRAHVSNTKGKIKKAPHMSRIFREVEGVIDFRTCTGKEIRNERCMISSTSDEKTV